MKGTKITTDNYFETIEEIGFENLPKVLQESHMVILSKTDEGEDWDRYKNEPDLKRMVNLAFKKLEEFVNSGNKTLSGTEHPELKRAKEDAKNYHKLSTDQLKMIYRLEQDAELEDGESEWITIRKRAIEREMRKRGVELDGAESGKPKRKNPYGEISTEVKFINRFLDFNDKILYKKTFEIFIDELQRAISEKQITKKSPVAKDIMAIQQAVLTAFNSMSNAKHFVLKPATVKRLKAIIEKYENAYDDIDESYLKVKKKKMDLSGINQSTPQVNVMPSTDFSNLHFDTIGFKDKWLSFIGDPAPGFTAMVFGMPKMGKSYLCVDFAGYLARNHGRVLYVAKEEKLDATLQKKLKDKDVAHENLFVADALPADLSAYDFIFLDSVNKLGLQPKDLDKLKADNKGKSFIYIFQATKGGKFKGNNEFQHDVDVVIEVPEQGKAVQFGRFNQGGEMDIFENSSSLSGVPLRVPKDVSMLAGNKQEPMENGKIGKELKVKIAHNSWGDVAVLKHGNDWHAILHPDDIKAIAKLRIWEKVTIKDEQGYTWEVRNNGEGFNIKSLYSNYKGHFKIDREYLNAQEKGKTIKKAAPVKEKKYPAWTSPEHMSASDHEMLRHIYDLYSEGRMQEAMDYASHVGDTAIREEIPGEIWKAMGGQLTPTGETRLKKNRKLLVSSKGKTITKKTELGIALEELAIEMLPEDADRTEIVEIIYSQPKRVEEMAKSMAQQAIDDEGLKIKIKSFKYRENDSDNITTGASYFDVVLEGEKNELKKIAGDDKLFYCEW